MMMMMMMMMTMTMTMTMFVDPRHAKVKPKIEEDDIGKLERSGSRSKAAAKLAATHRCLSDGAKRLVYGIRGEAGCPIQKRCCYMASAARLDATNCIITPRWTLKKHHLRRYPLLPRHPAGATPRSPPGSELGYKKTHAFVIKNVTNTRRAGVIEIGVGR